MKKASIFLLTLILLVSVIFGGCNVEDTEEVGINEEEKDIVEIELEPEVEPIDYKIVEIDDLSIKALGDKLLSDYTTQEIENLPIAKRKSYKVLVSLEIEERQVRPTVEKIINDITTSDKDIDSIHLLLYSDEDIIDGVYDVAMATWAPGGDVENITPEIAYSNDRTGYSISLTIKENLEEYLKTRSQSEEKHGLTEEERRKIYKEIADAEDRAMKEADDKYPTDIMKNIDKMRDLEEKYKKEIRDKYGITEEIQIEIVMEGIEKNWPY